MAVGFLLPYLALGMFWSVVFFTLRGAGLGVAVAAIGLPILVVPAALVGTRAAMAERRRIGRFLGYSVSSPYEQLPEVPWPARARARAADPAFRRDLLYMLLLQPVAAAQLAVVLILMSVPIWMLASPLNLLRHRQTGTPPPEFLEPLHTLPVALISFALGIPVAFLTLYGVIGLARAHAAFARTILGPSRHAELAERVEALTESRSRVMDASLAERRRIEQDLHDGAQQRLVSLAMGLGLAKEKMKTEPAAAHELVEEAHEEAKQALSEIRELVRGIHPAVLTDRGLDAAISALAGRCPMPVSVEVRIEERSPEAVESTAYFVVAEALTNVARHSGASEAHVSVWRERNRIVVEVYDDGVGGAKASHGSGLSGIADRLAALDGELFVQSPPGGPTRVRAELPLGPPNGKEVRRTS